jgi:large subunit ribosomal protein L31e
MMKAGETRTYTIPLRKEFLKTARWRRAEKAVNTVRSFVVQHAKAEDVKVGRWLNEAIWKRGAKNPPARVRVDVKKEDDYVMVELSELPRKAKKEETKPADLPEKVEEKKEEKTVKKETKTVKKTTTKKTPAKKPVVKKTSTTKTNTKSSSTKSKKKE